jgi:hypothetical protein
MTDCLAPHLPEPQPNHKRLAWLPSRNDPRYRALAWTCHCADVIYELCMAGGQSYLRRTDLTTGNVSETHGMRVREGEALWQTLLQGRAQ